MDRDSLGALAYRAYATYRAELTGVNLATYVPWEKLAEHDREPYRQAVEVVALQFEAEAATLRAIGHRAADAFLVAASAAEDLSAESVLAAMHAGVDALHEMEQVVSGKALLAELARLRVRVAELESAAVARPAETPTTTPADAEALAERARGLFDRLTGGPHDNN
jgi:hypothetical protein